MRISIIPLILFLIFNLGIDIYIYIRVIVPIFKKKWIHILYWGTNILLIAAMLLAYNATKQNHGHLVIPMLIWFMFGYFAYYIPKGILVLISLFDLLVKYFTKKRSLVFAYIGLFVAFAVAFVMLFGATFGRNMIKIEEIKLTSKILPKSFDGYRIVQISDLHLGNFSKNTSLIKRLVTQINDLNPDVIFITGDVVNLVATELSPFMDQLSLLNAPHGIYSVLGNHDYGDYIHWDNDTAKSDNMYHLKYLQSELRWTLLNNEHLYIHQESDSIGVIGVENWGEPPFPQHGDLKKAMQGVNDSTFNILLSHNPKHWENEVRDKMPIHLTLSGHTHAMQIQLGNYSPSKHFYPYWGGLYKQNNQHLYVNRGIGIVFLPIRIGAIPEITLITLQCTE